MDFSLSERVAFVAGSSSGLGLASALELAREGCRVAICSRSEDRIHAAAQSLADQGVPEDHILPLACDVTSEPDIQRAIAATVDRFGGLNILVTNAGGPPPGRIKDFDADDWRAGLELNLISTINLTRHALPHLEAAARQGLARVIMVSSLSAKQPVPTLYQSNVSRAGVQGFARSLAEELGPQGITVNTVLPGYTRTARLVDLARSIRERTGASVEQVEASWAETTALGRIGRESEFAAAVAFLASERASYITGVALPIDGGAIKSLL